MPASGPAFRRARAGAAALARLVLAAEEAAGERAPGDHSEALELAGRHDLLLDVAHDQAVLRLVASEAGVVVPLADGHRLHQPPAFVVAAGDVAHLASAHEIVEGAEHLLQWRLLVDVVDEVEVDMLHAEPAQAVVQRLEDVGARHAGIVRPRTHRVEELGGDDGLVAPALQRVAQHGLRFAGVVGVRCVEHVDAGIERQRHQPRRLRGVGAVTEGHRPQADLL